MEQWLQSFIEAIHINVLDNGRYMMYLNGLGTTVLISLVACLIGFILGSLVAIVKVYHRSGKLYGGSNNVFLKIVNSICDVYITVIRGTPMTVQLLIMYFVIFATVPTNQAPLVAMLAFGINSGAYVAEIVRAGILAVDRGQTEAGRSLGLTQNSTMRHIILPQAIKNVLPALGNEFIVLFKETSIVGFIAVQDLTQVANMIRTNTYNATVPLLTAGLLYLILVIIVTWLLRKFERRLARSDYR